MTGPRLRVLSIGCSCITRFQFQFFLERAPEHADCFPKGLFDWNISSLESTLNILQLAADGTLEETLRDPTRFHVAWDTLILNTGLPGFSFFHEDTPHALLAEPERRDAFLGKVAHLAEPFTDPDPHLHTHLIWSNLQPNLPDTVRNVIDWEEFTLTESRYDRCKSLAGRLFGPHTMLSFLSTPQDMSPALSRQPDVYIHDIPRDATYTGAPDLYDSLLRRVVSGTG